jgi:hypothetical protein
MSTPIVYWQSPFALQHPTMAVVEALLIGGAGAYLWKAVRSATVTPRPFSPPAAPRITLSPR